MKLEEFLDGRDIHEVKREFQVKIKNLDAQVRHAAIRYLDFLWQIGHIGKTEGDTFIVSAERLQEISKRASTSISPISLDNRLEALSRIGFIMETLPTNEYRFISKNYPRMFPALHALPYAKSHIIFVFDFRNISSHIKLTHDDYFNPLITEQRERAYDIHNFAMERKMRLSTNANWGVVYHYKSKQVMTIKTNDNIGHFLGVGVVAKDKTEAHTVIDKHLGKESQDFQEYALQRMSGCDANQCLMCSTYSSGNYVTVLGKRHQVCGEGVISYDWHEPVEADMAMIKRLIEIRCEHINEEQAAKKAKS